MAKTAMINARIEPKLKKEVEGIFQRLGLNTTQAVSLFFRHVKNYRGLPFEVKLPNAATRRAIEAARKGTLRREIGANVQRPHTRRGISGLPQMPH